MASSHVLVMDDVAEVLDLLRDVLREEGYRVSPRPTVVGLDEVKRLAPDVILLDLLFGGQHRGLDLLRQLRQDRATADVPVVVCSAAVDAVRRLAGDHVGEGVGLVLKPFDIDELLGELRALESWRAERSGNGTSAVPGESGRAAGSVGVLRFPR